MKLDPGSTDKHPSVVKTSTPAILMVMIEVCVFTALLGLAMHALTGLQVVSGDVNAPGGDGVRDYMLRYMGQVFVGGALGPALGHAFGFVVSIVFAMLLLSAVNTAIVDLIMIQFLMSRDREVPAIFHRLNKWGVPSAGMLLATIVPMLLVLLVKDMAGLADLYAVGVVGAIATNLGATATDRKLSIKSWERTLMFSTFVVMAAIEMSLLIDKPSARYFAVTILAVGLILRGLVLERRMKKEAIPKEVPIEAATTKPVVAAPQNVMAAESILCAIRGTGRTLDFALHEARDTGRRLYLLFVREQLFMTEQDAKRKWQEDPEASMVFADAKQKAEDQPPLFCYAVSPSAAETIVDVAATLGASRVILGAPQRSALINLLRGNVIREVSCSLPETSICWFTRERTSLRRWESNCTTHPRLVSSTAGSLHFDIRRFGYGPWRFRVPAPDCKHDEKTDEIRHRDSPTVPEPQTDRARFREHVANRHARGRAKPDHGYTETHGECQHSPIVTILLQGQSSQRDNVKDGGQKADAKRRLQRCGGQSLSRHQRRRHYQSEQKHGARKRTRQKLPFWGSHEHG